MHAQKEACPSFLGGSPQVLLNLIHLFAGLLPAYDDGASSLKLLKEKKHTQTGQQ
jgi:hypothetical protein